MDAGRSVAKSAAYNQGGVLLAIIARRCARCGIEQGGPAIAFRPRPPIEQKTILQPGIRLEFLPVLQPIIAAKILPHLRRIIMAILARRGIESKYAIHPI